MSHRIAFSCLALFVTALAPRSASADAYFRTYRNAVVHWTRAEVTVRVDPAVTDVLGDEVTDVVRASADAWAVSPEVPVFHVTQGTLADRKNHANRVWLGFGEPEQFTSEVALTIATTDANTGAVRHVEVLLNPAVKWGTLGEVDGEVLDRYDLQAVLTHEFGHVLGLDEDDARKEATMHPQFRRGQVHQRTLEASDEHSVTELYRQFPPSMEESSGCSVSAASAQGAPGVGCLVALAGVLLRVASRRTRRAH